MPYNRKKLISSLLIGTFAVTSFAFLGNEVKPFLSSAHEEHTGYHYNRVESTCTSQGHIELWTCCECHEYFTTNPGGSFVDLGTAEAFSDEFPQDALLPLADHALTYTKPELIGYKHGTCGVCHGTFDVLMTTEDISFSAEDCYGANPTMNNSPTEEGNRGITGGVGWQGNGDAAVLFPRVDYTAFSNVIFEFGTSSATWGGGSVGLTINSSKDLLDIPSGVAGVYGAIQAIYNSESSALTLTSRTSTGVVKSVTVTDQDVINGTSSLSGTLNLPNWRCFYLNKIDVNHLEHTSSGNVVASAEKIGHKVSTCSVCLGETQVTEVMQDSDIDLYNGYGLHVTNLTGYSQYNGTRTVLTDGSHDEGTVYLPKTDFTVYTSVRYTFYYLTLWGRFGFTSGNNIGGFGDGSATAYIYLDVTNEAGTYVATLTCPEKSASASTTITDTNVLNGDASLEMYLSSSAYSSFCFKSVSVVAK